MYNFDLVITLFNGNPDDLVYRLRNLNIVLSSLPYSVHPIIVEQKNEDEETVWENINLYRSDITYILKKRTASNDFNKCWLYNIGVKNAKSNRIILGESDCAPANPLYFGRLLNFIEEKKCPWAYCWEKIYYLKENLSEVKRSYAPRIGGPEGGLVYFRKDYYWDIGGANEWMNNLGAMDNELMARARFGTPRQIFKVPERIFHYWHMSSKLKGFATKSSKHHTRTRTLNKRMCSRVITNTKKYIDKLSIHVKDCGGNQPLCDTHPNIM